LGLGFRDRTPRWSGGGRSRHSRRYHTVDYEPSIKSRLARTKSTSRPDLVTLPSRIGVCTPRWWGGGRSRRSPPACPRSRAGTGTPCGPHKSTYTINFRATINFHIVNFRATCGENVVTRWSRSPHNRGERTPRTPPCGTSPHDPTIRLISNDRNKYPLVQISQIDGHTLVFWGVCQRKSRV